MKEINLLYDKRIGNQFCPNGISAFTYSKMLSLKNPFDVFENGCVDKDLNLESPVSVFKNLKRIFEFCDFNISEFLIDDADSHRVYYYPICLFGAGDGCFNQSEGQINYNVFDRISTKVYDLIRNQKCNIIFDACDEGHEYNSKVFKYIHDNLDERNILYSNVWFYTSNHQLQKDYQSEFDYGINIVSDNFFEAFSRFHKVKKQKPKSNLKKHFICLNRSPRQHRDDIVDFVIDNDLLEKSYTSYPSRDLVVDRKLTLSAEDNPANDFDISDYVAESFMNVITETFFYEGSDMITEKTYKSMLFKKPFIIVGGQGTLKRLREDGYKTFDVILNEDYDLETDNKSRIKMIQNEILRISKLSLDELSKLQKQIEDILEHNYNNFLLCKKRWIEKSIKIKNKIYVDTPLKNITEMINYVEQGPDFYERVICPNTWSNYITHDYHQGKSEKYIISISANCSRSEHMDGGVNFFGGYLKHHEIDKLQNNKCLLHLSWNYETLQFNEKQIKRLHDFLDDNDIPSKNVLLTMDNHLFKSQYEKWRGENPLINIYEIPFGETGVNCDSHYLGFKEIEDVDWYKNLDRKFHMFCLMRAKRDTRVEICKHIEDNHSDKIIHSALWKDKLIDDKYHWEWDGNRKGGSYDSKMDLHKTTNNVYHHAFVEIVTECSFYQESYDTIQMTDKTFKPIVNLTPFIIVSSAGHLKVLKKLGYKTFDFLIDERYDEVENPTQRLKMIKDEITRLSEMDLSEIKRIYIENFDILLYNKELYDKRQNVKIRHDLRKYYDKFLT